MNKVLEIKVSICPQQGYAIMKFYIIIERYLDTEEKQTSEVLEISEVYNFSLGIFPKILCCNMKRFFVNLLNVLP